MLAEALRTLAAVCVTEMLFTLVMPEGSMKKQLRTVCAVIVLAQTIKVLFALLGR